MRPLRHLAACFFLPVVALAAADKPVSYSWRGIGSTGVFPAGDLVASFCDIPAEGVEVDISNRWFKQPDWIKPGARKNIVWRTLLPDWGNNVPVVMGDRVYLMTEEGYNGEDEAPQLICLSAVDGKILWKQPVDHLDAWPAAKQKEAKELRARDQEFWRRHMQAWHALMWDDEKHQEAEISRAEAEKRVAAAKEKGFDFSRFVPYTFKDAGPETVKSMRGGGGNHHIRTRYHTRNATGALKSEVATVHQQCREQRIYWRQGWTSENPWYGSTMGSVVGDGETIYAVTALGGAAAYDPEGKRLWVTDLGIEPLRSGMSCHIKNYHMQISSPVLAAGHLVYYSRDMATMYGVDCRMGKLAWKVASPAVATKDRKGRTKQVPRGHALHMAPGGTPVVLELGDETVVFSGHGMAVRVRDGRLLGQLRFAGATGKDGKPAEYGSTYCSWAGRDDVVYGINKRGPVTAFRVGIDGDALTQEILWKSPGEQDNRGPNLVVWRDHLFADQNESKPKKIRRGLCGLDLATGKLGPTGKDVNGGYSTSYAVALDGLAVGRNGPWSARFRRGEGSCWTRYAIKDLGGERQGLGVLANPLPEGAVRERHINFLGVPSIAWGCAGISAWGNRIFIRNNDHLWCIGDPKKKWVPPEKYLER